MHMNRSGNEQSGADGSLKTIIYARYSSDNQREASIADQIKLCRRYCAQQGWDLVVFDEAAQSGSPTTQS